MANDREEEKHAMLIDDSVPIDAAGVAPVNERRGRGVLGVIKSIGRSRKP